MKAVKQQSVFLEKNRYLVFGLLSVFHCSLLLNPISNPVSNTLTSTMGLLS